MSKGDDREVYSGRSSAYFSSGGSSSDRAKNAMNVNFMKPELSPYQRIIKCARRFSIHTWLDVTGSNIEFANIIWDKLPGFHGQIQYPGKTIQEIRKIEKGLIPNHSKPYLPPDSYEIAFHAVGDANSDKGPIQVCQPAVGKDIASNLEMIWKEGNGGGQIRESYEQAALYSLDFIDISQNELSWLFMLGDEKPYRYVDAEQAYELFGKRYQSDIPTEEVIAALQDKFKGNLYFFLNPYFGHNQDGSIKYPNDTEEIYREWKNIFGKYAQNVIRVHEEKSVIDLMLGVIAMSMRERTLDEYEIDLKSKEQTDERIGNVNKSLGPWSDSFAEFSKKPNFGTTGKKNNATEEEDQI